MAQNNLIDKSFQEITYKLKKTYENIKKELNTHSALNETEVKNIISLKAKKHFKTIKNLYIKIWLLLNNQGLDSSSAPINPTYQIYKNFFQKNLHDYFLISPFCERVYKKPLNYAGDFIMMKYIYDNNLEGNDLFAKFIHNFSLNIAIAQSVRLRKKYIIQKIRKLAKNKKNYAITNIACGPALEIKHLLQNEHLNNCSISLLDSEPNAIEFLKTSLIPSPQKNIEINFHNDSILNIITNKIFFYKQDLIYSVGLFDYLSDKLAQRLINKLFLFLNKGGKLIIGNLKSNEKVLHAYMELLGEWFLKYRNEEDLMKLTDSIADKAKISIDCDPLDIQLYLVIEKIK